VPAEPIGQSFPYNPRAAAGSALVANEGRDIVYEVWYFAPTSLQAVLRAPEFSEYSLDETEAVNEEVIEAR